MDTKLRCQYPEHKYMLHDCARRGGRELAGSPGRCVDITAFSIEDKRQVSGVVSAGEGVYTVHYYAIKHMAK